MKIKYGPVAFAWLAVLILFSLSAKSAHADPFRYSWNELAPGVWVGIREDSPRIPVMGTTTLVLTDEGVIVFDGGGMPLMAERAIEKVRDFTNKPVTHVVISHWHGDHNLGISAYLKKFPNVQIIGHPYTRAAMLGKTMDYVEESRTAVPDMAVNVRGFLETGAFPNGTPLTEGEKTRFRQFLDDASLIDSESQRMQIVPPAFLFEERLVIQSGGRTVELLHLGKANTAGDVVMWLPDERIVATGDIVVRPTPYGFGSWPRKWAETLRRIKALGYETLIPGHGDIQHDTQYVDLLIETMELITNQMEALVAEGLSEEEAAERLDFSSVEERFTGGDPFLAGRFTAWFKNPISKAAYKTEKGELPEVLEEEEE